MDRTTPEPLTRRANRAPRRGLASLLLLSLLSGCSLLLAGPDREPHALIIGLDGVRPDALQAAHTPNLDRLVRDGQVSWDAYAGGGRDEGDPTQQATSSGPGWTSILTGVWVDRHGVRDNDFAGNHVDEYPHLFVRLREARPDLQLSSVAHWTPIHEHLLRPFPGAADFLADARSDAEVETFGVGVLERPDTDVLFLHFDEVDGAGHGHGYAVDVPAYIAAIETVDAHIGEVLAALGGRATRADEDWLVMVTTDHGGLGTSHGGQSVDERAIFVIARRDRGPFGEVVTPGPGHTIVARTVLEHMGVDPSSSWHMADGEAFGQR